LICRQAVAISKEHAASTTVGWAKSRAAPLQCETGRTGDFCPRVALAPDTEFGAIRTRGQNRARPRPDRTDPAGDFAHPTEGTHSRSKILRQILSPFRAHALVERLARARHDGERIAPVERLAGVDDHARVAAVGVAVVAHRVERRAPAAAHDVDVVA